MIVVMGRLLGMVLLLAGCNQLLGIDDVTAQQDPLRDTDGDGTPDIEDNCPSVANPDQTDSDGDNRGDACDEVCNASDVDSDHDGTPDNCDLCPTVPTAGQHDEDSDGIGDECDNCPATANATQSAMDDLDSLGDACDPFDKLSLQSRLVFDAFAPYDPAAWTDTDGVWSADPGGDAVVSAVSTSQQQGLRGKTSLGSEPYWYVETAVTLGPTLGRSADSVGIGLVDASSTSFRIACMVFCKPDCQLLLQRDTETMKGSVVVSPGTYVIRLMAQKPSLTPTYTCELLGVDKVVMPAMLSVLPGVPTLFSTTPSEFRYVHAVR